MTIRNNPTGHRLATHFAINHLTDRVGRFLPEEVEMLKQPNAPYWQDKVEQAANILIDKIGVIHFLAWVDDNIPEEATHLESYNKLCKKLEELK